MSMREIDKYGVLKEKLQGICDNNNLTFSIKNQKYPFIMTVKPLGGVDAQQTMMEGMDDPGDTGYISPDASLVFAYRDGVLSYKISETFTISDALFSKIKNHFKKLHDMWMMHFFRDIMETSPNAAAAVTGEDRPEAENPTEDENCDGAFDEFLDDAEDVVEDEDTEAEAEAEE